MAAAVPETHVDLLAGPVVVALVTVMPDGQPQATPVWCSFDGTHVLVNSARGRRKDKNMTANPKVTILALDPQNPFRWLEVRGTVVEHSEAGAVDHINQLAKLYMGRDDYYATMEARRGKETRVVYRIKPERVNASG